MIGENLKSTDPPAVRYCQASSADAASPTDTPNSRSASAIAKRIRASSSTTSIRGNPPVSVSRPAIVAFVRALARPPKRQSRQTVPASKWDRRVRGQGEVVASFQPSPPAEALPRTLGRAAARLDSREQIENNPAFRLRAAMDKQDCLVHYPLCRGPHFRRRVCSRKGSYRLARIAANMRS